MGGANTEKIKEIVAEVMQEMRDSQEWYTNKDLYEMLEEWKGETQGLKSELQEFKVYIRHYNGISDTVNKNADSIKEIKSVLKGRDKAREESHDTTLVTIGVLSLVISLGAAIIMLVN